ncbi:MAG: bifunctional hydroxymethylpyrimidine kinase/phosphomethylpyrimidine kinase [Pyrinomonadaceae bacterium]
MKKPMPTSVGQPVCLSIAGLDPSGGAGIIADIKTFAAFRCYGAAVVTSVTFQNTQGVFGAVNQSASSVERQTRAVLDDIAADAVKTGMLPTRAIIAAVARVLAEYEVKHLVVDPVVRSTSGYDLIDDAALRSLTTKLFPLAAIVTPNVPEAERIARMTIRSQRDLRHAAEAMLSMGAERVLIKGGHYARESRRGRAVDHLFSQGGDCETFEAEFIKTRATHGTGCTLASAIAAGLARGSEVETAVAEAKSFVSRAIASAPMLGRGHSPIDHLAGRIPIVN